MGQLFPLFSSFIIHPSTLLWAADLDESGVLELDADNTNEPDRRVHFLIVLQFSASNMLPHAR